jgi:predicted permease
MNDGPRERGPLRPQAPGAEVDEEIAGHLEMLTERYIREGMSPAQARAKAEARFGDPARVKDAVRPLADSIERRRRLREYLAELRLDLSFAIRTLRRAPLFTTVAVLTLAVAIGANTAMFSVVHRVLLRPLPYEHESRLWSVVNSYPGSGMLEAAVSPSEFTDLQEQLTTIDEIGGIRPQPVGLTGDCGSEAACDPQRVVAYAVSANLFSALGARPYLGTAFRPDDGAEGAEPTAVLSHALWVQRFGADSGIIGRTITAAGVVRTVLGVMPPEVRFPDSPVNYLREPAEMWIPYDWTRQRNEGRGNQFLVVIARSRMDAAPEQVRADLDRVAARFKEQFPPRYTGPSQWRLVATPLRDEIVGDVKPAVLLLWGIVGLILLIACANVANLLLARSAARETEMAVRAALGAGRGRIVRQLLTEALVLGVVAGGAGLAFAAASLDLVRVLAPATLPQVAAVGIDGAVLQFALVAAFGASLLCGLLPAVNAARGDLQGALRSGSRSFGGARVGARMRRALVMGEVALTLVVLVSAGLLLRTFQSLQRIAPAFDPQGVMSFEVTLPRASYADAAAIIAFHANARATLAAIPGVTEVGAVLPLPLAGEGWSGSWYPEGRQPGPNEESPNTQYNVAVPGYFATMRIPLREGREFTDEDDATRPGVAIVNEALATRYWPGESAIGKRVNTIDQEDGVYSTVVGVVPTVRRMGAAESEEPQMYLPLAQKIERRISYVVRTSGDPTASLGAIREVMRRVDPALPLAKVAPMGELLARSVAPQRFNAALLAIFAVIALVLASGGLFGVVSYLVTQRDHELGVRLALGGQPRDILRLVVADGMRMALGGILIGLAGAWFATRALRGLLFGVSAADPLTWGGVALLLAVVAFLASYLPARRATRIDPVTALRGG